MLLYNKYWTAFHLDINKIRIMTFDLLPKYSLITLKFNLYLLCIIKIILLSILFAKSSLYMHHPNLCT